MTAYTHDCPPNDCGPCGTLPPGFVRLRYFYGKRLGSYAAMLHLSNDKVEEIRTQIDGFAVKIADVEVKSAAAAVAPTIQP